MAISLMGPGGVQKKIVRRTLTATITNENATQSVQIDATSVPGWQSLTTDNFYLIQAGVNPRSTTYSGVIRRQYNESTGKLTVSESAGSSLSLMNPVEVVCITLEDE